MGKVVIEKEQLRSLPILKVNGHNNESIIYQYNDDYLLKIYNAFIDLNVKEKDTNRLINLPMIDHVVMPKDKVFVDNTFVGFTMPYIKNSEPLKSLLGGNIDTKSRIAMGKQLSTALKTLHSYNLIYGDIHFDNIIATNTSAFLIDADCSQLYNKKYKGRPLYYLKPDYKSRPITKENFSTDNIKLFICVLSFMYDYDIEQYLLSTTKRECRLDILNRFLTMLNIDHNIKSDINKTVNYNNQNDNVYYFDYYSDKLQNKKTIKNIDNDSIKIKKLLKK